MQAENLGGRRKSIQCCANQKGQAYRASEEGYVGRKVHPSGQAGRLAITCPACYPAKPCMRGASGDLKDDTRGLVFLALFFGDGVA